MITWQQLRDFKAQEYKDAADGWGEVSSRASAAKDRVDNEMLAKLRDTQSGDTARAALRDLDQLSRNFQYIHTECGLIRTALNGFASELAGPQRKLKSALDEAQQLGFTVKPDGSVQYPAAVPFAPETGIATPDAPIRFLPGNAESGANPNKGRAEDIAERIAAAVRDAAEVDGRYRSALTKLKAARGLKVDDAVWADAGQDLKDVRKAAGGYLKEGDIPKGKSPADNKKWWESLTQEQRDEYTALYPASVGRLDGLPSTVRDEANRIVLAETHGTTQLQLKKWLETEPERYQPYISPYTGYQVKGAVVETEEWKKWNEKKGELEGRLKGMENVQSRFNTSEAGGRPPAYLLGFDNNNLGHAIISIGNPDTADNVVTFVPGTGAKLSSVEDNLSRAEALQAEAESIDSSHKTASILWQGYDAPQDIVGDAMDPKFADRAREPLSNFLTGIETAHDGKVNSTVLGHSYGTLVAGETMRDHPALPVDRAILVGSPGVGVDHAKDLNIPPERVWAATAKNDLINLAPPQEGELSILNPMAYKRFFDDHSILYGCDPTTDDFGGKTFKVADGKAPGSDGPMPAHSQYWEGESLTHMANIVTGGES
ncbi:alpha/beta hydrolase family protein [Streptomyces sp. BHT-5-2]|uniref:alpha/beta hydrolase n=1 Tax=Streptomyces sp. BHT-5-2 TaxID=2866715 RepID=UPI001C8E0884|nr:alpha/beta hydrolase [Streptomyces sp. BHT-5-2]QZL02038.1 alpha/beta hydrolase family protein [Streptomyces sp. BHT-5-2]